VKLSNLGVTARLALGFGVLITLLLIVAGFGTVMARKQIAAVFKTVDVDVQHTVEILKVRADVANMRRFEKDLFLNVADRERAAGYMQRWRAAGSSARSHLDSALAVAWDEAGRASLKRLAGALEEYRHGLEALYSKIEQRSLTSGADAYAQAALFRDAARAADHELDTLSTASVAHVAAIKPWFADMEKRRQVNIAVGVVVGLLASLVITMLTARSITVPLNEAVRVAEALAQGDLAQNVEVRSKDELGRLMQALRGTVQQLGGIVGKIKEASDKVNSASREIAQANLDLSTRTDEQASALEETSSSMQEISATVAQNAQNARSANDLSTQTTAIAVRAGEVVRDAVGTMDAITESSKRIADIIGVIDAIAFQTNILALNAAVEAARAGEQGRGFAVVASEVRSLAQRSAGAAKEIKTLITDSVSKVDAGSRQVNEAGRTMDEILSSVTKVNDLIGQISKASEEQAQGIEQVTEAITQLEQVTQQNAAMVEQASAAAGSLEDESRSMRGAVGAFRLTAGEAATATAPRRLHSAPAQPAGRAKRPAKAAPAAHAATPAQLEPGWQTF